MVDSAKFLLGPVALCLTSMLQTHIKGSKGMVSSLRKAFSSFPRCVQLGNAELILLETSTSKGKYSVFAGDFGFHLRHHSTSIFVALSIL